MKVSVVMYQPPEDAATVLGVIKGTSVKKLKELVAKNYSDDPEIRFRLVPSIHAKNEFEVEESYFDEGEWTEYEEVGATVYLDNHVITE